MTAEKIYEHFMKLFRFRERGGFQKEKITEKENGVGENDNGPGVPGAIIHRPGEIAHIGFSAKITGASPCATCVATPYLRMSAVSVHSCCMATFCGGLGCDPNKLFGFVGTETLLATTTQVFRIMSCRGHMKHKTIVASRAFLRRKMRIHSFDINRNCEFLLVGISQTLRILLRNSHAPGRG